MTMSSTGQYNGSVLGKSLKFDLHPQAGYLASVPIITANWEADSDQRWTVPVGGGVGKIFRIGKQPINMSGHVYYNAIKPDVLGDWTLRIQFQLMFPR